VIIKDELCALGGELGCERRGFLPAPLAVVLTPHGIRPAIAVGYPEPHPVLREHVLELFAVNGLFVFEGVVGGAYRLV
jgi:hypothetical protein